MDDRDAILSALPISKGGERPHSTVASKAAPKGELWTAFVEMLVFHKGEIMELPDLARFRDRAVCDPDVLGYVQETLGKPVHNVWDAEAGVTLCDLAVAETGSLLLTAGPKSLRMASLAPPVHVALVRAGSVVSSLDEALGRLSGRTSVLVTGPSRTADIEGVMVMGVHGPKRLLVVLLPEQIPA